MSNKWTPSQLQAINQEGCNIIVSAGAGSGKTAVLTERVIRKLKNKVNINNLLILTFTKAAANEMKERIRKEIRKDPSLAFQEQLLDTAYITTFDSYALSLINRYHYLLNMSDNIMIADENIINIAKKDILKEIFYELYEKKDENFCNLISTFCLKDDDNIFNSILAMDKKLQIEYNRHEYLKNYIDIHYNDSKINLDIAAYEKLIKDKINYLKFYLDEIEIHFTSEFYNKLVMSLQSLINANSYDEYKLHSQVKLPRIGKNEDENACIYKDKLKKLIDEINKSCEFDNREEIYQSIMSTKGYVSCIVDILLLFDQRLTSYKEANQLFDFNDIAFKAIKLIKENKTIQAELKATYSEILLDEYQDTNDLQDLFISLIANNNVYMVGDVKQSIYRFRNANPNLFMHKYNDYANNINGIKIDLNKNFRSRNEVINNINAIFNLIMDDTLGGANYKKDQQMEFGNFQYEDMKAEQDYNYEFINYGSDESKNYSNSEIEAFIIAKDIINKIDNKYQVYDKESKELRTLKYHDITILVDRSRDFELFKKIFEYLNIPLEIDKDDNITDSYHVQIVKNLLILLTKYRNPTKLFLDNEFKHAFVSIARSFIFEYDDNTIFKLIKETAYFDNTIYKTLKPLIYSYERMSIKDVIIKLYELLSVEEKLIKIGKVQYHSVILEYLTKIAESLSLQGYNVEDYIKYIETAYNNNLKIVASINKTSSNSCKIMTIHKSKGLEYNLCYFPLLSYDFNKLELKERFLFDNKYGFITPYFNQGIGATIYKELLKNKHNLDDISEKIRLLYVALTRCKEHMVFIINTKEFEESRLDGLLIPYENRIKYSSFNDIISSVFDYLPNKQVKELLLTDLALTKDYNLSISAFYHHQINQINRPLKYLPVKVDVIEISATSFSKKINKILTKNEQSMIDVGTKLHEILEEIDFLNPQIDNLDISYYYQEKISKFLASPIFNNINNSLIYKEYEFSYYLNDEIKHGVIDLMIEDDTVIKIIDYKLKNIDDDNYNKQLTGYLEYIKTLTTKKVEIYLYSLLDETLELIDQR